MVESDVEVSEVLALGAKYKNITFILDTRASFGFTPFTAILLVVSQYHIIRKTMDKYYQCC